MVTFCFTKFKTWSLLFLFALVVQFGQAQDIHFSQFKNAPILLNPALTGVFNGQTRIMGNFRTQWNTVPVGYRTVNAVFDTKAFENERKTSHFGFGGAINYDEAGDTKLGTVNLSGLISYSHRLTARNWLTVGVDLTGSQRRFDLQNVRTDNQWGESGYNPNETTGESFADQSIVYADFGVGANWHYQKPTSRTNANFGVAMRHINSPTKSFFDNKDEVLPSRQTWYGLFNFETTSNSDFLVHATGSYQGKYIEHVLGLGARLHLSKRRTKELAIMLGVNLRVNGGFQFRDAVIPTFEVDYQNWRVGVSYDVNLSKFNNASFGNGGPELSMRYIFKRVGDSEYCPTCPTYL